MNLLARYSRWMATYPHLSNMTSGAAVMAIGDTASQYIESGSLRTFDPVRTCIMSSFASLFVSPYCVKFYGHLAKKYPGFTAKEILTKGILSNIGMSPITNAVFFGYSAYVEGAFGRLKQNRMPREVFTSKMQNEYTSVVVRSAYVWIPFNVLNFAVIPPQFRVIASLAYSAVWNCYLSLVQHRPLVDDADRARVSTDCASREDSSFSIVTADIRPKFAIRVSRTAPFEETVTKVCSDSPESSVARF